MISKEALTAAVEAYDAERCRLNDLWHGGRCGPMSDANKETIRPMILAAVVAALESQLGDRPAKPSRDEIEAARTQAGGWTREQLAKWGVPWPPPKGWRKDLEKRP